jgi:hypothetical protein
MEWSIIQLTFPLPNPIWKYSKKKCFVGNCTTKWCQLGKGQIASASDDKMEMELKK